MNRDAPNLDVLRSIAVTVVVLSHLAGHSGWSNGTSFRLGALGFVGVAIFFVHTTLVLMMSLERQAGGPRALPFLLRRALRIYPLAIVTVLAVYASGVAGDVSAATLWSNLFLVQNLTGSRPIPAPLWSLPFEVQMYLVLPFVYLVTTKRFAVALLVCIWLGACVAVSAAHAAAVPLVVTLLQYVPCFVPGAIAYALMRHGARQFLPAAFLPLLVAAFAACIPAAVARFAAPGNSGDALLVLVSWVACLALGVAIAYCRDLSPGRVTAGARWVAVHSYAIYLVHAPVMDWVFDNMQGPWAMKVAAFTVATLLLSVAAYRLVEQPFIALGRRLAARRVLAV